MPIESADNQAFAIDLQLFAEGEASAPVSDAAPAAPVTSPEPAEPSSNPRETMSLADYWNKSAASQQDPEVPPVTPAPIVPEQTPEQLATPPDVTLNAPEPQYDVPDKFKNVDGSVNIEALAKSYTSMESMYGKQQNTVQQMTELQQTVIALQQQIATQAQSNVQPDQQLSPEQIQAQAEAENEKFWEEYNANPKQAIANLVKESIESSVKPMIEPIMMTQAEQMQAMQHQASVNEWNAKVTDFAKDKADFDDMLPVMREILDDPDYGPVIRSGQNAIEVAYNLAKSRQEPIQQAPEPVQAPAKTIDELLSDQEFVAKMAQNPTVKNMILQQHMQDIRSNPAPPVIGSGGIPPSSQPVDLKNMKTAREALKAKYAGMNFG